MSPTHLYFSTVQALPDGSAVVGGHLSVEGSSPTATLLLHLADGKWRLAAKIPDVVNAMTLGNRSGEETLLGILGRSGFFAEASVSERRLVEEDSIPLRGYGYMEDVAFFGGNYYAGGADRQVFRRGANGWQRIDETIYKPSSALVPVPTDFILALDAGPVSLCAAGGSGFAARFERELWSQWEVPTNIDLNDVFHSSEGRVFICGGGGLLASIHSDGSWQQYSPGEFPDFIFWKMAEFQGRIYIAAGGAVFRIEDGELAKIDLPFSPQAEIYAISAAGGSLWATGDAFVYQLNDQGKWKRHECPANQET